MADQVADGLMERGLKLDEFTGIYHHVIVKMMKQIRDLEFQYIVATDLRTWY